MTNYLNMTQKELDINTVMDKLIKKEIGIKEASIRIHKSQRHTTQRYTKRIKKKYISSGI